MLADGCPLGNLYGTATFSSRLLESRPARHSVTLRCRLGHLPFLPFQISEESDTRSQCNYARRTPILTQTKSGEAFEGRQVMGACSRGFQRATVFWFLDSVATAWGLFHNLDSRPL
jgi:hypothetical protein